MGWVQTAQDAGARRAHEGPRRHIGVGRAALVTVEALAVMGEAGHLPEQFQVLFLLLPLGAGRHGEAPGGGNTPGDTGRHLAGTAVKGQ